MNKAVFLDRDGTLNIDNGYTYKIEDLVLLEGVPEGLKYIKTLGYLLIIISNQSGIGRGYYTQEDCGKFNNALEIAANITFDGIYICPHIENNNCECRKPKVGSILKAQKDFGINLNKSYFIGDKESDIICGRNAGCKTIYINNDKYINKIIPDFIINQLDELKNIII